MLDITSFISLLRLLFIKIKGLYSCQPTDYLFPQSALCAWSTREVSSPNSFILYHQFLMSTPLFFAIYISLHLNSRYKFFKVLVLYFGITVVSCCFAFHESIRTHILLILPASVGTGVKFHSLRSDFQRVPSLYDRKILKSSILFTKIYIFLFRFRSFR